MPSYRFTKLASSDFTGSDEVPLSEGGNWVRITGDTGTFNRTSNQVVVAAPTLDTDYRYVPLGEFRDQYSRANLTVTGTGGGGQGPGIMVRGQSSVRSWYRFVIDHNATNNAHIRRRYTGVTNLTLAQWTQAFTDGDQFTLAIEGFKLYVFDKDLTLVQSYQDEGVQELRVGHVGLAFSSTETSASMDNWEGGAFSTTIPGRTTPMESLYEPDEGDFHSELKGKNWFRTESGLMVPCGT